MKFGSLSWDMNIGQLLAYPGFWILCIFWVDCKLNIKRPEDPMKCLTTNSQ